MASRLQSLVDQVKANYAGTDTSWFVGAEHIHKHDNWDRIVVYPTTGEVISPQFAAQGRTTEIGGIDDCVFERKPLIEWAIWAKDYEEAEDRLHGVLLAIEKTIAQADISISQLQERWITDGRITDGGSIVVLSTAITFDVLTSDAAIVAWDALNIGTKPAVGVGQPTDELEQLDITYEHEDS